MSNARILEDHNIARHGDTALPCRSRGLGNLHPSRLPCIACPQVEGIGRQPHGIDLGVGSAHETHALVGAVGPGRAARTDLCAVPDHRLREGRRAGWVSGAGCLVPGIVAVWITDASTTSGTDV